jgi:hypothetical protein
LSHNIFGDYKLETPIQLINSLQQHVISERRTSPEVGRRLGHHAGGICSMKPFPSNYQEDVWLFVCQDVMNLEREVFNFSDILQVVERKGSIVEGLFLKNMKRSTVSMEFV